jgi:hypothetical protein
LQRLHALNQRLEVRALLENLLRLDGFVPEALDERLVLEFLDPAF